MQALSFHVCGVASWTLVASATKLLPPSPSHQKLNVRGPASEDHEHVSHCLCLPLQGFDVGNTPHPELPDDHEANRTIDGVNLWPPHQVGRHRHAALQG